MVTTHCDPTPANQLAVPNFPGGAVINRPAGPVRGIVVFMGGLATTPVDSYPPALVDYTGPILPQYGVTLSNNLQYDGWVTVYPGTPGYLYDPTQAYGLQNCFNNDNGTGLKKTIGLWWDHVVNYVQTELGATWPIVPLGVSLGGLLACLVATERTSTISAYLAHLAPVKTWTANPNILNVGASGFFGTPNWTATVAAGSSSLPMSNGTLNIANLVGTPSAGPANVVIVRGTGGWQILTYTAFNGTNQFTGVNGGNTSNGSLTVGDVVEHSTNTSGSDLALTGLNALGNGQQGSTPPGFVGCETGDTFIGYSDQTLMADNAIAASQPVTLYQVSGGEHQLTQADVSQMVSSPWVSGGTYVATQIVVSSGVSYVCILGVSGSSTAPASDATHWTALSGGATTEGWFQSVVDPLCPAVH